MKFNDSVRMECGRFVVCCERIRERWKTDSVTISFFTYLSGGRWREKKEKEGQVISNLSTIEFALLCTVWTKLSHLEIKHQAELCH